MIPITERTQVSDIAAAVPASVRVFQRYGIDFCCGGKVPLGSACEEQGVSFREVADAIRTTAAGAAPDDRDWATLPLDALIDHIVATYHDTLREELPRLRQMASKVARVHGENAPHLPRLEAVVGELATDFISHMGKEEAVLFPTIRAIAAKGRPPVMPIDAPVAMMEHEHEHTGALLAELRQMTDDYVAPSWACQTFRGLYEGLSELEASTHVHVHLENNVLFPRALQMAQR
jgi:regulator of cell morphogenesis and NO signaling